MRKLKLFPTNLKVQMHKTLLTLLYAASAAVFSPLLAQTIWTGATDSVYTDASNWDNGLPTSAGNPGTIGVGATVTHAEQNNTGYFVTQDGGSFTGQAALGLRIRSGSYTINGGTYTIEAVGLQQGTNGNQDFIVNGGTVSVNGLVQIGNGAGRTALLDISGGSFSAGSIRLTTGSFNVSGGTISSSGEYRSALSSAVFTGGTSSFSTFNADAGFGITLGGTTAGSLTASTITNGANFNLNWLSGSLMTVTISSVADWAETYWDAGQIAIDGSDFSTLGNWAAVNGSLFAWDAGTNTLSLGSVIPEPSAYALLIGLLGLAWTTVRRRRS